MRAAFLMKVYFFANWDAHALNSTNRMAISSEQNHTMSASGVIALT